MDGIFTPTGDTAISDANGNYIFDNLDPGAYQVLVDPAISCSERLSKAIPKQGTPMTSARPLLLPTTSPPRR